MLTLEDYIRLQNVGILLVEPDVRLVGRILQRIASGSDSSMMQWDAARGWGEHPTALGQRMGIQESAYGDPTLAKFVGDLDRVRGGLNNFIVKEDTAMAAGVLVSVYDLGELTVAPAAVRVLIEILPVLEQLKGGLIVVVPTIEDGGLLRELLVPVFLGAGEKYGDLADSLANAVTRAGLPLDKWAVVAQLDGLSSASALAAVRSVHRSLVEHRLQTVEGILEELARLRKEIGNIGR